METAEVTPQTVEQRIATDLAPFDHVAAKIEALKKEYQAAVQAENDRRERELKEREDAMNAKLRESRVNELRAIGDTTSHRLNLHILTDDQFAGLKKEVMKEVAAAKKFA